jgi:hypothetical protein
MGTSGGPDRPSGPPPTRRSARALCAAVLAFEGIVIGLAIPVAITVSGAPPAVAGPAGAGLALTALVLAGLLRFRWAIVAGSLFQFLAIAAGVVVSAMFVLGGIFAALWFTAIWLGRRVERAEKR